MTIQKNLLIQYKKTTKTIPLIMYLRHYYLKYYSKFTKQNKSCTFIISVCFAQQYAINHIQLLVSLFEQYSTLKFFNLVP